MSALRRLWQPSEYRLQHAEWMAIIETWGNEWRCELYRNGEWYSFHDTRSFVERHDHGILVDAFVYYNPCTEVWDASLRFNFSSDECVYGSFEGRRFASRDAAKSWCERLVDTNMPLLAELAEVRS